MTEKNLSQDVLQALAKIQIPELGRDIVSCGFVRNLVVSEDSKVSFTLELVGRTCHAKEAIRQEAEKAVRAVPGVRDAEIGFSAESCSCKSREGSLPGVRHIIAVASGKGGVGKSTLSVNLALALSQQGSRVGLLDADIYGPTVPVLLGIRAPEMRGTEEMVVPVEKYGLRVISAGFFIPPDKAAIWRGPMLHQMIQQFFKNVEWGELDHLVIDLPPGTGDAALSVCHTVKLGGAIVVSTPQQVAIEVAQKAVFMLQKLECPILGIVENMSHYVCGHCGAKEDLFGSGGVERLCQSLGLPLLGKIPLSKEVLAGSDQGEPILVKHPDSSVAQDFREIARRIVERMPFGCRHD